MKILIALCAILAVCTARVVIHASGPANFHLLGEEECTWGPSYWCTNIKTAVGCNATKHCIKTIWQDMKVPEDNDSVCNVCKNMVQQARDQLESNQTQEDLKDVFEGSCKLIHVKVIVHECLKIVDEFIPDLVETLASQMNPSVVCSVAGLCNSEEIDELLVKYEGTEPKSEEFKSHSLEKDELEPDECSMCYTVAAHMEHKLNNTPRDKILQQMLNMCGELGTFSDACSATLLTYFNTIYTHMHENFNAQNICHLSGQCSSKFHKHDDMDKTPKVEIRPLSSVGMVDVNDDLPCKLCEQLVMHLRDILVANTTEGEFEEVLDGLCKQTKSFSNECIAIVDEYYPEIYHYLTTALNSNTICQMGGLCPAPDKTMQIEPIWPLVPETAAGIGIRIFQDARKDVKSNSDKVLSASEVQAMQLPIDRLMPFPLSEGSVGVAGKDTCALCEYVLHYIQDAITNPVTEEKVKDTLRNVCKKLPASIEGQCTEFVDVYGDAIIAILTQEIDPSQVCPMLRLCPTEKLMQWWHNLPAKYMTEEKMNKPSCPLCLLAVTQIYDVIKDNKTESNIESALDKLCVQLPNSLADECTDLVKIYSKELIQLLLADLTPQEVCVFMKLCDATKNPGPSEEFVTDKEGEILTNEIPNAALGTEISEDMAANSFCVICEFAMHYVDKTLGNERERNKIQNAVHNVCNHLPKSVSQNCNNFVTKYGDIIIDVIAKDVSPKQVCTVVGLCSYYVQKLQASVTDCAMCKLIISTIDDLLDKEHIDDSIVDVVSKVCTHLPRNKQKKCTTLIKSYEQSIINLVKKGEDMHKICGDIGLCPPDDHSAVSLETSRIKRSYNKSPIKHCTWGSVYWCSSYDAAHECKAVDHCKEHVWKADFPPSKPETLRESKPNA